MQKKYVVTFCSSKYVDNPEYLKRNGLCTCFMRNKKPSAHFTGCVLVTVNRTFVCLQENSTGLKSSVSMCRGCSCRPEHSEHFVVFFFLIPGPLCSPQKVQPRLVQGQHPRLFSCQIGRVCGLQRWRSRSAWERCGVRPVGVLRAVRERGRLPVNSGHQSGFSPGAGSAGPAGGRPAEPADEVPWCFQEGHLQPYGPAGINHLRVKRGSRPQEGSHGLALWLRHLQEHQQPEASQEEAPQRVRRGLHVCFQDLITVCSLTKLTVSTAVNRHWIFFQGQKGRFGKSHKKEKNFLQTALCRQRCAAWGSMHTHTNTHTHTHTHTDLTVDMLLVLLQQQLR